MHKVDAKLNQWMKAYERLKDAQTRYKEPGLSRETSEGLREEISNLQRQAETALNEVQAEFAATKSRTADPSAT